MKLIFKRNTDILKEYEITEMTDEIQKEIETFDDKQILKYEITFKEGVLVKKCHDLGDISDKMVSALTITLV
jgi:hypothetical protein